MLYRGGYVHFYLGIISRIAANVLLSWYLGLHLGLFGIGLASVISLLIALAVKSTFLLSKKHGLPFSWYLNAREALETAKLGFPESALSVFVVMLEIGVNSFTLKAYAAAGVAFGPVTAFALMVVFVCVIKKEKLFDYSLMHLE